MPVLELARALVFEDPLSLSLLARLELIAPTDVTVLVTGETGTGKEIVARHVHERSTRARAPFVAVNCGALTPSLLESELFGHEKGAFTGALASKAGWFEEADGGTLFLDEIGDLPLAAQVKLLRVLQEREVVRVGARRPIAVDVRLIAATNVHLERAVADGRFREDLYYRVHVARLEIPPLRERPRDVLALARHFLNLHGARLGLARANLTDDAAARLLAHPWPGNIRELENAMHHALLVARDGVVAPDDLRLLSAPARASSPPPAPAPVAPARSMAAPADPRAALASALTALFEEELEGAHEQIEAIVFRTAYEVAERNQLRTARLLGISRNIVRARLIHHGLLGAPARASSSEPLRVRVGHQPFGALSLLKSTRALDDGLRARGVALEWTEHATGMQVIDAITDGALDFGIVGESPPVFAQAACAPVVYLAAEPPAPEGEAIVVPQGSPARSLLDLRGRTLAVTRGANVVYFVVRALEEVGLTLRDVTVRPLAPAEARAAFEAGEVDAWAVWNPHLAALRDALAVRILRDARGLAPNRAFYVARRAFADDHPELVEAFLERVGVVGARPIDDAAVAAQQHIADTFLRLELITRPLRIEEALWAPPAARRSA